MPSCSVTSKKVSSNSKTYFITCAQSIQTEQHAQHYGPDSSRGEPNIPFLNAFDKLAAKQDAETIIVHTQGMTRTEQHLHPFFEKREDVTIPIENLERLNQQIKREHERARIQLGKKKYEESTLQDLFDDPSVVLDKNYLTRDADYFKQVLTDNGIAFNRKITLANVNCPPQNKNPENGAANDAVQQFLEKSIIHAHPRQKWIPVPKGQSEKLPRLQITTGACTKPNYNPLDSRGKAAKMAHQYGFARVDIINGVTYLPRIVPAMPNGDSFDLGYRYSSQGRAKKVKTLGLVLGDIHDRNKDAKAWNATYEMIAALNPETVIIHDGLDGESCNPHELDDRILRVRKQIAGKRNVREEVEEYAETVIELAEEFPKTNFMHVPDNHGFFLYRWANRESGRVSEENMEYWHELNLALIRREDEKMTALETALKLANVSEKNVQFLRWGQNLKIGGYQVGAHGHKGINGARGSFMSMKKAYGKIAFGHEHAMRIDGNTFCVGTLSEIPMDYQLGQPSTSMHGNVAIYEPGIAQGIPIIYGKWRKE